MVTKSKTRTASPVSASITVAEKQFLNSNEAAHFLGLSYWTLAKHRSAGIGPRFARPNGGRVLYHRADLEKWARGRA